MSLLPDFLTMMWSFTPRNCASLHCNTTSPILGAMATSVQVLAAANLAVAVDMEIWLYVGPMADQALVL